MRDAKQGLKTPENPDAVQEHRVRTAHERAAGGGPVRSKSHHNPPDYPGDDVEGWLPVPRRWAVHKPPVVRERKGVVAKPRRVNVRQLWPVGILFVATAALFYFLPAISAVVMLTLAAGGLAAAIRPAMNYLPGSRTVRALIAGLGTTAIVIGVVALAIWLVVRPVREQLKNWPELKQSLDTKLASWEASTGVPIPDVATLGKQAGGWFADTGGAKVMNVFGTVTNVGVVGLVVLVGAMYLLVTPPVRMLQPVTRDLPVKRRRAVHGLLRDLDVGLRGWLHATLIAMTSAAILTYVGYKFAGLRFAPAVAMLAGLGETIPNIGPLIAFGVALVIALTQDTTTVIWVVGMYVVIQAVQSYWIQPLAVKKTVAIPEFITLLSLILWGGILGAPGLLMATPINLLIWGVYEHFVSPRSRERRAE